MGEEAHKYHKVQFKTPYRSTVFFDDFLRRQNALLEGTKILDLACGGGANEYYFGKKYPEIEFTGIDITDTEFQLFYDMKDRPNNVSLKTGDWFHLDDSYKNQFEGVISLQSLSWLSEWKKPLGQICDINPKWFALSSLFYEGNIEYTIQIRNWERSDSYNEYVDAFYNIYSLQQVKAYLFERGYKTFLYEPFEIDIDLPKPNNYDLGTYTIKTDEGKRIQVSAAMMMPWYFIYAER